MQLRRLDAALTVAGLSESQLLGRIFPRLIISEPTVSGPTISGPTGGPEAATHLLLGPGDDAAIVAAPDGRTVLSIDTQVVDQDFRLEWNNGYRTSGYDVGWKAAAQNLSDINAMGARATSLVVSLTMPPETLVSWVEDFADGLAAGIRGLGALACAVAGGDLGRGRELAVSVAILGTLDGKEPVLRSGARPGDTVALAGTVGRAAAGLALLESAVRVEDLTAEQRSLMDTQCRPQPPLAAGPLAREAGASAMMDISDGLVRDGNPHGGRQPRRAEPGSRRAEGAGGRAAAGVGAAGGRPHVLGPRRRRRPRTAGHFPPGGSAPSRVHCDRLGRGPCTNRKHGSNDRGQAR